MSQSGGGWVREPTRGGFTTLRSVLADAEARLTSARVPSPAYDASELMAHVLGVPRSRLVLSEPLPSEQRVRFEALLSRRLSRIPLQHLTGTMGFRRIDVLVGPGVFIPRPESELLTESAIRALRKSPATADDPRIVVDLCSGSGSIALSLAIEAGHCRVYAVEVDEAALGWASRNVEALASQVSAAGSTVSVINADASTCAEGNGPLSHLVGSVDLVVCNPPYIPDSAVPRDPEVREHDPARALYGGPDGLDIVRGTAVTAVSLLVRGGVFVVEHGDLQGEAAGELGVPHLLREQVSEDGERVWSKVSDHPDLAGRSRYCVAIRS